MIKMDMSTIPNKSTFTFNEVCSLTSVKPYVLRFWESEFSQIDPVSSDGGNKLYDLTDLMAVFKVKKLLFDEKLSIPKAKQRLVEEGIEMVESLPLEQDSNSENLMHQSIDLAHDLALAQVHSQVNHKYTAQLDLLVMKSLLENTLSEVRSLKDML
jgi:DNA-binding transcriptional MerR regulator